MVSDVVHAPKGESLAGGEGFARGDDLASVAHITFWVMSAALATWMVARAIKGQWSHTALPPYLAR
jgi:hypothetical protein